MIQIQNVYKTYKSGKEALDNINLHIQKGEFVALLGPNGAGKSTLINIMAGNVLKTSGRIAISGYDLDEEELETKNKIGIVPQEVSIDSFFTVNEVLLNQSGYFGKKNHQMHIDWLLEKLTLSDKKHTNTKELSGGMRRRLLIAKALVHDPDVIVLDEPTAGVDIELRQQLYDFLKELHQSGKTIVLTTHYLEEAQELCDRVVIINKGKIIADDNKTKLLSSLGDEAVIEFQFDREISEKEFGFLGSLPVLLKSKVLSVTLPKSKLHELFALFAQNDILFKDFSMKEIDLQDVFLKLVK